MTRQFLMRFLRHEYKFFITDGQATEAIANARGPKLESSDYYNEEPLLVWLEENLNKFKTMDEIREERKNKFYSMSKQNKATFISNPNALRTMNSTSIETMTKEEALSLPQI